MQICSSTIHSSMLHAVQMHLFCVQTSLLSSTSEQHAYSYRGVFLVIRTQSRTSKIYSLSGAVYPKHTLQTFKSLVVAVHIHRIVSSFSSRVCFHQPPSQRYIHTPDNNLVSVNLRNSKLKSDN
jgi:hypothetical protein